MPGLYSSQAPRVLVVDDDATIRGLLREALSDEGYDVDEASDGAEALEKVRAAMPDAILVDLMMPVMAGPAFVAAYRNLPNSATTPIIVLSATHNLSATAVGLKAQGVRACIAKPFDLDALLGMLERVTRRDSAA